MTLYQITQCAGLFVEGGPSLNPPLFAGEDIDRFDKITVSGASEQRIICPEYYQVLRHLFGEVMVDPINLPFLKILLDILNKILCGWQVGAKGFFEEQFGVRGVQAAFAQ